MRKVDLPVGHEIVNSHELATLRRKARAHDAYLWATRHMADKARKVDNDLMVNPIPRPGREYAHAAGYSEALRDFARLVMAAPSSD